MLWEAAAIGGSMNVKGVVKWVGLAVAGVAAIDLMWGNTSNPILPASVGNMLSQQTDIILLIAGGAAFIYF